MMSFEHWPSTMRDPSRTSLKYHSGVRCSLPAGGPSVAILVAFIFAHCTLTRAKAISTPSMQTDHLMASSRGQALTSCYFGLVKRLVNACPRFEVIKRSFCIEGARRAFARAKVHWAKVDAEKLVKEGPPEGKEHRRPEN